MSKSSFKIRLSFVSIIILIVFISSKDFCQQNSKANLNNIKLLMIDGKYREAIKDLDSLITIDSANVQALYFLGLNYESISNYNKAASVLKSAAKYKPDDTQLLLSLGSNYFSAGLINDADTVLSKAFSLDSSSSQIQLILGKVYMAQKKWDNAAAIYARLIEGDSSNSYFFEQMAKCETQLGNADSAISNYMIANKLNPQNINTTLDLSYLLYLQKGYSQAIKVVEAGLKFYPFSIDLWKRKGDIYISVPDYDNAMNSYYYALVRGDSTADNLKNIGICLYWRGQNTKSTNDYESALNFLNHSIDLDSKDAATFFYLGAVYKARGDYKQSLENFIKASNLLKNDFLANTYIQIAAVYQLDEKYNDALEYYRDALRESPANKSILFYIAVIYDKLKSSKSAENFYAKFLSDSNGADKKLIDYAKNRVEELKNNKSLKR